MIKRAHTAAVLSVLLTAFGACGDSPAAPEDSVARIEVIPGHAALGAPGEEFAFGVALFDARDRPVSDRQVSWASSDDAVATVASDGSVVATGTGSATITAAVEGVEGVAVLVVAPDVHPPGLRSVEVDKRRVNVLNRSALIRVTAELTDDRTGVSAALGHEVTFEVVWAGGQ